MGSPQEGRRPMSGPGSPGVRNGGGGSSTAPPLLWANAVPDLGPPPSDPAALERWRIAEALAWWDVACRIDAAFPEPKRRARS